MKKSLIKKNTVAKEIAEGVISFSRSSGNQDVLGLVENYIDEEKRNLEARIFSPVKLSKNEQEKAAKFVNDLAGEPVNRILFTEDETLIDGLKIMYKDKLWDFSLQSQLNSIVGS